MSNVESTNTPSKSKGLELCEIRPLRSEDGPFVYATWLQGLYFGNRFYSRIPRHIFFDKYKAVISHFLIKGNIQVMCLKDDPDVILGYCCTHDNVLDWVFVKSAWRKLGIAGQLVPKDIKYYSHWTESTITRIPKEWEFNPFLE